MQPPGTRKITAILRSFAESTEIEEFWNTDSECFKHKMNRKICHTYKHPKTSKPHILITNRAQGHSVR